MMPMTNKQLYGAFGCLLIVGYAITTWAACSLNPKEQDSSEDLSSLIVTKPITTADSSSIPIIVDESDAVTEISSSAADSSSEVQEFRIDYYIGYDEESSNDSSEESGVESLIEQMACVKEVDESYESLEIPYGQTDCFLYMDYRTLTDTSSKQWELQQSAWTDWQGFRRIGDDYCVALGTYYGEIGDRFRVTTDKGNTYTAIMSDAKGSDAVFYDDVHSWYHYAGNGCNVVEFIVQTEYLPSAVTISGSCGAVDYLSGNIVSIERID
jgi:hypothetical protein